MRLRYMKKPEHIRVELKSVNHKFGPLPNDVSLASSLNTPGHTEAHDILHQKQLRRPLHEKCARQSKQAWRYEHNQWTWTTQ